MKKIKKTVSIILCCLLVFSAAFPFTACAVDETTLRNKIVSVAKNEVGYVSGGSYSKYGEWYGYQGAWCTYFALWCYNQAGNAYSTKLYGTVTPNGGNCNSMISWFENKGRYYSRSSGYTPKAGDFIFFDWSGNGSSQHIGIVNYVSGSTVYTIEGNCSGAVKAKSYSPGGSYPYASTSAIMGYGVPDFSGVASGSYSPETTTKKKTTTTTEAPATTTTKKHTTTTTTTTETTTEPIEPEELWLDAISYDLQVGDTVNIKYEIKPANATSVVGYFCDEEGIIEIEAGGEIRAVGVGTATVVVCANDTLYEQCDIVVTEATGEITSTKGDDERIIIGVTDTVSTTKKNAEAVLGRMGINLSALTQNKPLYIIPITIICSTALISLFVTVTNKIKKRKREDIFETTEG